MSILRVEIYHGPAVIEYENGTTHDVVVRLWNREHSAMGKQFSNRHECMEGQILTPMSEVRLSKTSRDILYLRCQNVRRKMSCQRWSSRFVAGEPEAITI